MQLSLTLKEGVLELPGSNPAIYTWGYECDNVFRTPGPLIRIIEGETIELTVTNSLREKHNFAIKGTSVNITIQPGQTQTAIFTAPSAGTYMYMDTLDPAHRALGLCGGLISMSQGAENQILSGKYTFDRQYFWLFTSIDSTWNTSAMNGQHIDTSNYRPNYFFINGLAYPEGMNKMSTPDMHDIEGLMIHEMMGNTVLIRMANASLVPHAPHLHGFHLSQVTTNRTELTAPMIKDSILVPPTSTLDALLTLDKMGMYMCHDHILMSLTANGVYPNGALAMFDIM
jgi:FtsP/CotA-like multicopper oxidase with cupredoxin domain